MEVHWHLMVVQVSSSSQSRLRPSLVLFVQVMSSTSHVVHVGNFHLRSECEQAARDAGARPSTGTPSDHAAYYCVRAYKQRVVMHSPPPG